MFGWRVHLLRPSYRRLPTMKRRRKLSMEMVVTHLKAGHEFPTLTIHVKIGGVENVNNTHQRPVAVRFTGARAASLMERTGRTRH
jgi:hypothetical protein